VAVEDLRSKHGFSDASFYAWRARLGGMGMSEVRRLRELEAENVKLKKLQAEAHPDTEVNALVQPQWRGRTSKLRHHGTLRVCPQRSTASSSMP
jgi:hypothetical protein